MTCLLAGKSVVAPAIGGLESLIILSVVAI
jgi:hypothetical protein